MNCIKCKSESVEFNPDTKRFTCLNCDHSFSWLEAIYQKETDPKIDKEKLDLGIGLFGLGYEICGDLSNKSFFQFVIKGKRR